MKAGLFCSMNFVFFFFKQKTAYEVRISDWSSDVCSSDLPHTAGVRLCGCRLAHPAFSGLGTARCLCFAVPRSRQSCSSRQSKNQNRLIADLDPDEWEDRKSVV